MAHVIGGPAVRPLAAQGVASSGEESDSRQGYGGKLRGEEVTCGDGF
jgi:hypothetical protein